MRIIHQATLLSLTTLAACYDGREDASFPDVLGESGDDGGGSSSGPGGDDDSGGDDSGGGGPAQDDATSGGSSGDTGDAGDASTGGSPSGPEGSDALAACESCGCFRWSTVLPADASASGATLTALTDGGVLVTTTSDATLTLRRVTATGSILWTRSFPGQVANARAIPIGTDFVAIAGTLTGSLVLSDANPAGTLNTAGGTDGFAALLSITGEGAMVWGARFGDEADQKVGDLAAIGCEQGLVDGCRLQLAGVHAGVLGLGEGDAGVGTHVFHSQQEAVYWQPKTATVWRMASEPADSDDWPTLATAPDGSVTMVATVRSPADLGDVVVRRLDAAGQEAWTRRFTLPGLQQATSAVYAGERVWLAGNVYASTDLGAGPFGVSGGQTAFIAALDADGDAVTSRAVGGSLPTRQALATTATGMAMITGYTNGDVDLGGGVLTYGGGHDVILARYDEAGAYQCGALYGDGLMQEGLAAANHGDRTFVLARVDGSIDFGHTWQVGNGALVLAAFSG